MTDIEPGVVGEPTRKPASAASRIGTAVAAVGATALLVGAAKTGLLSDKPGDYQMPTGVHSLEKLPGQGEFFGKLRLNEANVRDEFTDKVIGQGFFPTKLNLDENGNFPAIYDSPKGSSGHIDPKVLSAQYGVDLTGEMQGWPVWGTSADPNSKDVVREGNRVVPKYEKWTMFVFTGKDGVKREVYVPDVNTTRLADKPTWVIDVGK